VVFHFFSHFRFLSLIQIYLFFRYFLYFFAAVIFCAEVMKVGWLEINEGIIFSFFQLLLRNE